MKLQLSTTSTKDYNYQARSVTIEQDGDDQSIVDMLEFFRSVLIGWGFHEQTVDDGLMAMADGIQDLKGGQASGEAQPEGDGNATLESN